MTVNLVEPRCEYGYPTACGAVATWRSLPDKFPTYVYGCDIHGPLMFEAHLADRLPAAPEMFLTDHKAYVTALAWSSYLLRTSGTNKLRAENASYKFRQARDEYNERLTRTSAPQTPASSRTETAQSSSQAPAR